MGQKNKDVSAVPWFGGPNERVCAGERQDGAQACCRYRTAGQACWGDLAKRGLLGEQRGRYLLIWAPRNRFASMDAYPARLGETRLAFIRRADGSESAGAGPGADHVRVGTRAEGRSGVSAWGGEACVHGDECVRVGGVRSASCMWGKRACVRAWQA